jgi:signal peptidase I
MLLGSKKRNVPAFGDLLAEDDQDIEVYSEKTAARRAFWAEGRLLVRDLIFALMFAVLLVVFVIQPVKVEGTSMLPRLHDGERIFVNKMVYYELPRLTRGDVVVFWYPNDPSKSYVKRVIGLPGETVEVREGRVIINGQTLNEPYLDKENTRSTVSHPPVAVKEHYFFVMGDNRDHSSDSREWGLVPEKYIYGKAVLRYWPVTDAGVLSHHPDYNIPLPPRMQTSEDEQ